VRNQVDWKVERRDACDRAKRETANDAPASGCVFLPIEGKVFAVDAGAFFGSDIEGKDGAVDLAASRLDGLSGLLGERASKLVFALDHVCGNLAKNALTFKRWKTTSGAECFHGGCDSSLGMSSISLSDTGDQAGIVRGADFDYVALLLPSTIHKETVRRNRRDRHLCHVVLPPGETSFFIIGLLDAAAACLGLRKPLTTEDTEENLYNGSRP